MTRTANISSVGQARPFGRPIRCPAIAVVVSVLVASSAHGQRAAQAYCALRDPNQSIFQLFPDATGFSSSVKNMARERNAVNAELPYKLHFNELGRHTLYVVLKGAVPQGLVHVRPAAHEWGLVEVAWAFSLDMKVLDFKIQRCRNRLRSHVENEAFRKQVIGRGRADLESFLSDAGYGVNQERFSVSAEAVNLAAAVLRSGLSSLVITEVVWPATLTKKRLLWRAADAFGPRVRTEIISRPYTARVTAHLRSLPQTRDRSTSTLRASRAAAVRVTDDGRSGRHRGFVLRSICLLDDRHLEVWWTVDGDGRLAAVDGDWNDQRVRSAFSRVVGRSMGDIGECQTAVEIAAFEILAVCQGLGGP